MKGKGTIVGTCIYCGDEFLVYPSQVRKGRGKYCSLSCSTTHRNYTNNPTKDPEVRRKISENHAPVPWLLQYADNGYKGTDVKSYRTKAIRHYGEECSRCKSSENIQVHHIDRNRENNAIENLEVLCSRCHLAEHAEEQKEQSERRRCPETGRFMKGVIGNV